MKNLIRASFILFIFMVPLLDLFAQTSEAALDLTSEEIIGKK
ncbi:MAG: hypothetical protein ABI550_08890 [Ignavibacteriaceae bacterium]